MAISVRVLKNGRLSELSCLENRPFLAASEQFWLEIEIENVRLSHLLVAEIKVLECVLQCRKATV